MIYDRTATYGVFACSGAFETVNEYLDEAGESFRLKPHLSALDTFEMWQFVKAAMYFELDLDDLVHDGSL